MPGASRLWMCSKEDSTGQSWHSSRGQFIVNNFRPALLFNWNRRTPRTLQGICRNNTLLFLPHSHPLCLTLDECVRSLQIYCISSTVRGYKFNHMATKLTTLTAFTSASLKGLPVLLEGLLENKNTNQNTNKEACFWNFELSFLIWILWGFKDRHRKKKCSFWWISVDFQLWLADFF